MDLQFFIEIRFLARKHTNLSVLMHIGCTIHCHNYIQLLWWLQFVSMPVNGGGFDQKGNIAS